MPVLRRCAGKVSMRRSSNHMLPASTSANPAISRSSVVLPHPDGPRRVNSLPSSIVAETLSTARTAPKVRLTLSRRIVVMGNDAPGVSACSG